MQTTVLPEIDLSSHLNIGIHHRFHRNDKIELWNIILLGIAFAFIYTSFGTSMFIEEPVVASVNDEFRDLWDGKEWAAHEFIGINFAAYAFSGWISPSLIAIMGPKMAMIIYGLLLSLADLVFIFPFYSAQMISSIFVGLGQAVVWTAQGNFLTVNSRPETLMRNSGIFWVFAQTSLLIGNCIVYNTFEGKRLIDHRTRVMTYTGLTACSLFGVMAFFVLRANYQHLNDHPTQPTEMVKKRVGPWAAFCNTIGLMRTKKIILLCFVFIYTGLEGSFFSGVYNSAVAFPQRPNILKPKRFSGLSGALTGAGQLAGGFLTILVGNVAGKDQSCFVIFLGFLIHIITFAVMYFNLHLPSASFNASIDGSEPAIVHTSLILALLCSFLIGFGDACYQNQIMSFLGKVYRDDSSPPFAIFIFFQYLSTSVAFYYSSHINLGYHIYILTIAATIGTLTFFAADRLVRTESKARKLKENTIFIVGTSLIKS